MNTARMLLLLSVYFLAAAEIDSRGQEPKSSNSTEAIVLGLARGHIDYKRLAAIDTRVLNQRVLLSFQETAGSPLQGKQEWTPLIASIECGNHIGAAVLVSTGADVNLKRSDFGNSPLWMLVAARNKDRQAFMLLTLLLDFGADPNFAPTHVIDGPFLQTPIAHRGRVWG